MKLKIITGFFILTANILSSCRAAQNFHQPTNGSINSSGSVNQPITGEGLTASKVETAVNWMLTDWRLGGSVRVRSVQELPQQNSAIADLQFEQFKCGVTYEGGIVKAKDFKLKPMPQGQDRLPSMEEMFPQKKAVYSKDSKAILSRYTDGRWVLKEVRWELIRELKERWKFGNHKLNWRNKI